jgi:hypothetical protein
MGLSGSIFFILIAPEETPWLGPWIDVPTVALSLTTGLLLLTVALAPAMPVRRRVTLGFVATGLGVLFNLINITAYDEPEAVTFLVVDAVLALLLGLAWRGASYAGAGPAD